MSETGTRTYELGYLLAPTVSEAEGSSIVEGLKALITKAEGEVKAEGSLDFIDLAYQMEKHVGSKKMKYCQAYFGWVKFDTAPEAIEGIKKTLDLQPDLIRYILLKTSVENTIVFKKPKGEAKREPLPEESIEAFVDEVEDMEDHEKLPDLADDIDLVTPASEEAVVKED